MSVVTRASISRSLCAAVKTALKLSALFLPATLLFFSIWRTSGRPQMWLTLGAIFQASSCILLLRSIRTKPQPLGRTIIALHLIALGWIWLTVDGTGDWYFHFAQSVLIGVPLGLLGLQAL